VLDEAVAPWGSVRRAAEMTVTAVSVTALSARCARPVLRRWSEARSALMAVSVWSAVTTASASRAASLFRARTLLPVSTTSTPRTGREPRGAGELDTVAPGNDPNPPRDTR